MGCVISREASSGIVSEAKEEKNSSVESNRKLDDVSARKVDKKAAEIHNGGNQSEEKGGDDGGQSRGERRRSKPNPRLSNPPKHLRGEQVAAGWPPWLTAVCGEALSGWIPRKADTFEKIDKIGQGTYSNVYKAKDMLTGKIVALKKVRFDNLEPESVKFMAREILILRRLDHPNVVKLEGLVTSRMSCSLYLVFEYMEHDLAGLAASPGIKFTEPQVKCYMHQLLSGLEHCHKRYVLHRDIKGSNLLIDNGGILKIADFGLASLFDPNHKHPMTSRVSYWLGSQSCLGVQRWSNYIRYTNYVVHHLMSIGKSQSCLMLPYLNPESQYKRCIRETFRDFPPSSLPLIDTLLAIDPAERQTASAALGSEFFTTEPHACDPSSLPKYPPSKEMDAKRRDDEARRLRAAGKAQLDGAKKTRTRDRAVRAVPAPEANAELQSNIDRRRLITHANAKSKSEKFPPPHQDGQVGFPLGSSHHIDPDIVPPVVPFSSTYFTYSKEHMQTWSGPIADSAGINAPRRKKNTAGDTLDTSRAHRGKVKGRKI
ncbi:Protein kinase superfamily protein [Quillaja saponaria]|uniref:Protein kinase superfamily protein n=1 Tax=Quillaja saponaria TaxID=32244 RepID=A0AAD7QAR7_QUISA|nr:Protein kinase superfamily protein [Quillaja saponaria]KAJ7978056.1 Protein kinase superfamily protein [Quillaja saponaria]